MQQRSQPYRIGQWLPSDQVVLETWLARTLEAAENERKPFHPSVEELRRLIESDPRAYMWFHQMFEQVPRRPPYSTNPGQTPQIRNYEQMLRVMNHVLTTPPAYNSTGMVGFPINAILDWSMGTEAGFAAFLDPAVNARLKAILNAWGEFLVSPASASVLNEDPDTGWLGAHAQVALAEAMPEYARYELRTGHHLSYARAKEIFTSSFECDPSAPHWGFGSWDAFFTRKFRPGVRPVAHRDDEIANACESAPFALKFGVKHADRFWIKGQPYSVGHMMNGDERAAQFTGGTVYQAFLSAKAYHCWNSPVSGTVVDVQVIDGTYYSEPPAAGFANPAAPRSPDNMSLQGRAPLQTPDDAGPNQSQGYISEMATRGLMFIEADDPKIGLMAFLAIGMAEVSSCGFTVKAGDRVERGQAIGAFHFGGSTHCLIFRPQTKLEFDLHGQAPGLDATNIKVCAPIARVL